MSTRIAFCAFLVLTGAAQASAPLRSGPQVGAPNNKGGFMPNWVSGPCAGQRLCPV